MKHFFNTWFVTGFVFLILGGLFAGLTGSVIVREMLFQVGKVVTTQALVTSHEMDTDEDDGDHYTIYFTFRDAAEHKYSGSSKVSEYIYGQTPDGTQVSVDYLEAWPDISRLQNEPSRSVAAIAFFIIGVMFFVGGCSSIVYAVRRGLRINQLLKSGLRVVGTVLKMEVNKSVEINDRNPSYLVFQFTDSSGQTHQAQSDLLSEKEEEYWKNKQHRPLIVYYDRSKPEINHAVVAIDSD